MRPTRALAFSFLAAVSACESASPTRGAGPPAAVAAVLGLYQLSAVQGMDVPTEIHPGEATCSELEPFRNPAGPRLDGDLGTQFFDGTLDLTTGLHGGGLYELSLSVRTRCTFGDGGHQEREDQIQETGGFVVEDEVLPTFLLRSPLQAAEGSTHLESDGPTMAVDGTDVLLRAHMNGVDMTLRFRRTI